MRYCSQDIQRLPEIKRKGACQSIHAKKRALQRYDLIVNKEDYEDAIKQIQDGRAKFISRRTLRIVKFSIKIKNTICNVIYDSKRHKIVTFLPPDNQIIL